MNWIKITKENYKDIPYSSPADIYFTWCDSEGRRDTFKGEFDDEPDEYVISESNGCCVFIWNDATSKFENEDDSSIFVGAYCIVEPFRD